MPQAPKIHSKIHASEKIFQTPQFSFVSQKITLPNGVDTQTAFVHHPGSTVIVPLFKDKSIGMIKQYRHSVNEYLYEIPAGTMNSGEIPEKCAERELEEEIGYVAGRMIRLGRTFLLPAYSDECSYVYLATNLTTLPERPKLAI